MKKTTTRLATIAAVLLMSAFAIVLAQYDSRRNERHEELPLASVKNEPTQPLDSDLMWPGRNPIVRANNERLPQVPPPTASSFQPHSSEQQELPPSSAHPSFTGGQLSDTSSWSDAAAIAQADIDPPSLADSQQLPAQLPAWDRNYDTTGDVVMVSGEQPAGPTWLPENDSLPALPANSASAGNAPVATLSKPQPVEHSPPQGFSAAASPEPGSSLAIPQGLPQGLPPGPSTDSSGENFGQLSSPAPVGNPSAIPLPKSNLSELNKPFESTVAQGHGRPPETGPRTQLVSNQPGSRFLDGSQNPILQILKQAPEEIQVGKKATFVITVRNAGNATAHEVTVVDRVPQGARFAESSPTTKPTSEGVLTWMLGEMAAGDERTISLQIVPEVEGEVGSVASVHFAAQASVRTVATLPQLDLQVESTGPVIIGQSQQIVVTIQNTGSGVARGVRLEADIPGQLRHESGEHQLEAYVGDLRPGESRRLTLGAAAVQPGQAQSVLRAVNDDGVQAERTIAIDVRSPKLAATISGPSLRYLERQASYQVVISNVGTAIGRNMDFVVHLPVGLKFISVDIPQATYNPQTHSISLGLAELDSGQSAPFSLTVLPIELGPQIIRVNATGDLGMAADAKAQVTVAGLAELAFTIGQDNGTVEVGASTTYAVQVSNIGNQPDKNVQLIVQLPEGTKLLQVDAPVEYRTEAGKLVFAPLADMRSRDVKTFRFQLQHNRAGNQVIRSQLTSENWPVAVVKEEGTLVYNDQN